jgi:hypothetical protein
MCQLFFQNKLVDVVTMARMRTKLAAIQDINSAMQRYFREWNLVSAKRNPVQMLDQASLPWFAKLNKELRDDLSTAEFMVRIDQQLLQLHELASEIVIESQRDYPMLDAQALINLLDAEIFEAAQHRDSQFLFAMAAH